jgi:hypothetical protein
MRSSTETARMAPGRRCLVAEPLHVRLAERSLPRERLPGDEPGAIAVCERDDELLPVSDPAVSETFFDAHHARNARAAIAFRHAEGARGEPDGRDLS